MIIMLSIALLELRLRRKWGKRFALALLLLSAVSALIVINSMTIRIDYGIYTSNVKVPSPLFVTSRVNPDIMVRGKLVFVRGDMKSLSAFDEFRRCVRSLYRRWIYEKYGERAFPVMVRVVRVGRVLGGGGKVRTVKGVRHSPASGKKAASEKRVKRRVEFKVKRKEVRGFETPDRLKPPSLLKKLIYAFSFIIPMYFVIQVYSSSLMEDKIKRRMELLFAAEDEWRVVLGKSAPYLLISMLISGAVIAFMGKSLDGILFLLPIALFLVALGTFTAFLARSYKEMTFLTVIASIFVTVYLFIPAIFTSGISEMSPVAVMLRLFSGKGVSVKDYVVSTSQFYVMSFVLLYMSFKSTEVMYGHSNPLDKILRIAEEAVDRYWKVIMFAILSIPFVLLAELFFLSFIVKISIILALLAIGLIEEYAKGVIIYSAIKNGLNGISSAILTAIGFFIGEKAIILPLVHLRILLLIPLAVHVATSLIFLALARFGFWKALIPSSVVHAIYDGVIVWIFLGSALRI